MKYPARLRFVQPQPRQIRTTNLTNHTNQNGIQAFLLDPNAADPFRIRWIRVIHGSNSFHANSQTEMEIKAVENPSRFPF
jgi:hypothetical protein